MRSTGSLQWLKNMLGVVEVTTLSKLHPRTITAKLHGLPKLSRMTVSLALKVSQLRYHWTTDKGDGVEVHKAFDASFLIRKHGF